MEEKNAKDLSKTPTVTHRLKGFEIGASFSSKKGDTKSSSKSPSPTSPNPIHIDSSKFSKFGSILSQIGKLYRKRKGGSPDR